MSALRGDKVLRLDGQAPALPLDRLFALNPAMPNLHRLYRSGHASIVHAVATPYRERSHFDGQDVLESGLPAPGATDVGWLNRALSGLEPGGRVDPAKAFAVGPVTPLVVRGPAPVLSWTPPRCSRRAMTLSVACSTFTAIPMRRSPRRSRSASASPRSPVPAE